MTLALRACLFASAAAGLAACASNPAMQPASIDYRGDDPARPPTRDAPRALVMSDTTRPTTPPAAMPPPAQQPRPAEIEPAPYQLVADLGPHTGVSAAAEARAMAPEYGGRPGGARRLPKDNPSARAIEVQPKDTLYDISRRYNVNLRALIETNGLEPPYALDVGDTVFLPPPNIHVVEKGETLYAVSRRYNVDTRSLALLNGLARPWTVWPGDELLLPPLARDQAREPSKPDAAMPIAATPMTPPSPPQSVLSPVSAPVSAPLVAMAPTPAPAKPAAAPSPAKPSAASSNGPISLTSGGQGAVKAEPKPPEAAPPPAPGPVAPKPQTQQAQTPPAIAQKTPKPAPGSSEFIWPVSGSVVKGYGPAANGQRNDGINISAAKGTQLVAAAGGEVVYAGSELAGFGNLVLIRHPGGWVTAYAHADAILVAEGDLVKQGQAIATVGSTGNAPGPQVHFELRKGKEPVDPTRHLPPLNG